MVSYGDLGLLRWLWALLLLPRSMNSSLSERLCCSTDCSGYEGSTSSPPKSLANQCLPLLASATSPHLSRWSRSGSCALEVGSCCLSTTWSCLNHQEYFGMSSAPTKYLHATGFGLWSCHGSRCLIAFLYFLSSDWIQGTIRASGKVLQMLSLIGPVLCSGRLSCWSFDPSCLW